MPSALAITPRRAVKAARAAAVVSILVDEPAGRPCPGPASLAALLGSWVARLDERRRALFEHRIAGDDRRPSDISRQYGVSRQRISRQEAQLAAALSAWLKSPHAATLVAALQRRLEAACPVVAPWPEVAAAVPELADNIPGHRRMPGRSSVAPAPRAAL